MSYPDRHGKRIRESTFTEDWQESNKKLRERLLARDDKILEKSGGKDPSILARPLHPWRGAIKKIAERRL
jgi:hypothetical protein